MVAAPVAANGNPTGHGGRTHNVLGYYRFGMALIVGAHHAGWWPSSYKVGIPCVMAFLMISGHGVSALGERFFPEIDGRVVPRPGADWRFYQDRLLRIFPQYYVWLVITGVLVLVLHKHWIFHSGRPDLVNIVCNLTVFPVSFFMYIPSLFALFILPQTWSLSTELFFYTLFPALARWQWLGWVCAIGGMVVFTLGSMNVLPPEVYTYRLLPGTLPYIMLGRAVWRRDRLMQWVIVACFQADLLLVWSTGRLGLGLNRELLFGMLPTYGLFWAAAHAPTVRWDRMLGNLTYGIYLSHMAVLAMIHQPMHVLGWRIVTVVGGSIVLGWLSYTLVEVPMTRLRNRLKPKPVPSASAHAGQPAPATPQPLPA
jgi:peptidoglycan/LPS O-acetylase OafA/YrhL